MAYTTINKSSDYFNTKLYTGDGSSSRSITGVGFQPDWVWFKKRSTTGSHNLADSVRGTTKVLLSNQTLAEITDATTLTSFDSDGFSIGTGWNTSSTTMVSWNWKANGAGSANTDGSINSTVSANTTSGFSIVSYTGTGSNATIGHGLGAVPKMIITKALGATNSWGVYHASTGNNKYMYLDATQASLSATAMWNDTTPTSSVFSVGTSGASNASGAMIAYCFAEKTGYSKFGSYNGNTSTDGTFIYTGFKPAFLIVKGATTAESWCMFDNKRNTYNPNNTRLLANANNTEASIDLDFLSNGIKFRTAENAVDHANTYIYMAFGQSLVGSNNVPCTAR